jgi:Tol biopolymer transport system component
METGASLGDLEDFTTLRDGTAWTSEDFNFWGVTFSPTDSNTFYATLRSGGQTYLVKGDVAARTMTVVHGGVECPSLSPDGTRIAFKKLGEGLIGQWRLYVLDLATMTETPLAEERNIDDQPEWLDDDTVLYADGESIWEVPGDGTGQPSIFIADGLSPADVR